MSRQKDVQWYLDGVNKELADKGYGPVTDEQIECLNDPDRADEALDMIDHWEARCGLSGYWREELAAYIQDNYHIHQRG